MCQGRHIGVRTTHQVVAGHCFASLGNVGTGESDHLPPWTRGSGLDLELIPGQVDSCPALAAQLLRNTHLDAQTDIVSQQAC